MTHAPEWPSTTAPGHGPGAHYGARTKGPPRMQPLTAVVLAAPLLGPLTAAAYRHARRSIRRRGR